MVEGMLVLTKLDTCLLVTTLCVARWLSRGMHTDAVEVLRTLADTEKMVKFILLKATIKFGSIVKYGSVITYFAITYRKLYCFMLC